MKLLSEQEVLKGFDDMHGTTYDYSLMDYQGTRTKIKIICKIHDVYEQTPKAHLKGQGCSRCRKKIPSNEEFKTRLKEIYGDSLDYSFVDYVNMRTKVKLICKEHGEIEVFPKHLIYGKHQGCYKCENKRIFLKKVNQVHGNKYDYSLVKYDVAHDSILIICPKHDVFEQLAYTA